MRTYTGFKISKCCRENQKNALLLIIIGINTQRRNKCCNLDHCCHDAVVAIVMHEMSTTGKKEKRTHAHTFSSAHIQKNLVWVSIASYSMSAVYERRKKEKKKAPLNHGTAWELSIGIQLQTGNNTHRHTGTIQEALAHPCLSYYSAFSNTEEEQVTGENRPIAALDRLTSGGRRRRRIGGGGGGGCSGCLTDTMISRHIRSAPSCLFLGVPASHPISSSRLSS